MENSPIKERVVKETVKILKQTYGERIESIAPYLDNYVTDIFENSLTHIDKQAKLKKISTNIYRTKKRWADKVIDEYKQYQENTLTVKKIKVYAMLTERYHNELISEVSKWQSNKETGLLSFPGFEILTQTQKKQALEKDTIIIAGEIFKKEEQKEKKVYESVNSMIDLPIFGSGNKNRLGINSEEKFDESGNRFFAVDNLPGQANSPEPTTMYIDERFLKDLNAMVPDLNSQDYELFNDILQFRDYRFGTTHTIEVPLRALVELSFKEQHYSKRHFELIKKRLLKLGYYRVSTKNDRGDIILYGAFSDVIIEKRDGEEYAICTVTNTIFNAFLNHEITSIYNEKLPKLKGTIAYKLVFYLQKERLIAYQAHIDNPVKIEWKRFLTTIRLLGRTKREKIKEISTALQEIKDLGIILKDYYPSGDFFYLTFDKLSEEELLGHNIPIISDTILIEQD